MLYLDPSAWVKRYVREPGRQSLEQRLREGERLYSSAISYAEVHAALTRKYRSAELSRVELLQAGNDFEKDWLAVEEVAVDRETLRPVRQLLERVSLRGMDVIHLAAARWLQQRFNQAPQIIASDPRLLKAAQQFGFEVYDPARAEES